MNKKVSENASLISNTVDIIVVSSAYLSKLRLVSSLNSLHKLFKSAMTNSRNKLNRISDSKLQTSPSHYCFHSEPLC